MQPDTRYCQPNIYIDYLHTVKGIRFTHRQIDILVCLLTGRSAKSIAKFLGIDSERTVHAHELTIREKLGCASRDGILSFLEKCEELPALKKYYQILRMHFLYKALAPKIEALIRQKHPRLAIICKDTDLAHTLSILHSLKYYLILSGVEVSVQQEAPSALSQGYFLILDTEIPFQLHENQLTYNLQDTHDFYLNLWGIIKELAGRMGLDTTKIETEFHEKYATIHNASQSVIVKARPLLENHQKERGRAFIILRGYILKYFVFMCLGLCIFSGGWLLLNSPYCQLAIHSDLEIPTDTALLKREHIIKRVENILNKQQGKIKSIALCSMVGMGGVGKTTLARHYGRLQATKLVWELNAENKNSLLDSFGKLALCLAENKEEKNEIKSINSIQNTVEKERQILMFVKKHLRSLSDWVLIYDNIENFDDVNKYLPQDPNSWGNGKVIITTRNQTIKNVSYIRPEDIIEIGELSQDDALMLFSKSYYDTASDKLTSNQKAAALEFLRHIPPFPLDISVAARYIKSTNITYKKYLEEIEKSYEEIEGEQRQLLNESISYEQTRYGIISLSFRNFIKINPEFKDLLFLICFLNSQNIPLKLLERLKNSDTARKFIQNLKKNSLITSESVIDGISTFSIHRSTQALGIKYIKNISSKNDNTFKRISDVLENDMAKKIYNEDIIKIRLLLPHFYTFLSHKDIINQDIDSYLRIQIGGACHFLAQEQKGNQILLHILNKFENDKVEEKEPLRMAQLLTYLGITCRSVGQFSASKDYLIKSLKIYKTYFPKKYARQAHILTYLGNVCIYMAHYGEAERKFEEALQLYGKHQLQDLQGKALCLSYLGSLYINVGNYQKAENPLSESLILYKKLHNKNGIARALGYIGTNQKYCGQDKRAMDFFEESLATYQDFLPRKSLNILWMLAHIGDTHTRQKNYTKAFDYLQECKKMCETDLEMKDGVVCNYLYIKLGNLEKEKKNYGKAKEFYDISYQRLNKKFGANHPSTAEALLGLGQTFIKMGDLQGAEDYLQRSLEINQRIKHSDAFFALESMADINLKKPANQNYKDKARECLIKALDLLTNYFPEDTPHKKRIELKLRSLGTL